MKFSKNEVLRGLENDEFIIFLQPQVNAATEQIMGFEALARWQHENNLITPYFFSNLIEEIGKEIEFDYLIFEKTCQIVIEMKLYEKHIISCNFSRKQFVQSDFVDRLNKIRKQYKLPAKCFGIEILEGEEFSDPITVQKTISKLAKIGYKIHLDDCFSEAASKADLHLKDVTHIKIDKSLTDNINNIEVQKLLRAVCEAAQKDNKSVICEGVETSEQAELVKKCGVNMIQGYFYYKPMPVEDVFMILAA